MSITCELPGPRKVLAASEGKPLEEAVWQAWLRKGRAQEERDSAARITSVKWLAIVVLLASGGLFWEALASYGVVVKFIIAIAAIALLLQAVRTGNYLTGVLFGMVVLIYNPVIPVFTFSGDWERALVLATVIPFIVSLAWRNSKIASRAVLTAILAVAGLSAATPGDLSKYRNFQLGSDLATVASQAGVNPARAKPIIGRPASILELEWSPQPLGPSSETEAVRTVLFRFYNDQLYQITVEYDRYKTEGLTADDIAEAVTAANGTIATHPVAEQAPVHGSFDAPEEVLARWEDGQYRVQLVHALYGPGFRLVATVKRLDSPVKTALLEAKRLDEQEAPQREAARVANETQTEQARLQKVRLVNKPKFRP
jgi:hypothetical protein